MERRDFLSLGAAAALSAISAPAVHAQQKRFAGVTLRVNGYGGTYDKTLSEAVAKPLEESTGLKVEYIPGSTTADVAKLLASKGNPHVDVLMCDSPSMAPAIAGEILEPVTQAEVPNLSRVLPGFREFGDYGVPFSVASIVPVYNSDNVKPPLTSYTDLFRPDLKKKVVFYFTASYAAWLPLVAIARGNGGSLSNMDPAFNIIAAAKENILATPSSSVAILQLFQQGEAQAGAFYDGRAYEARKSGTPLQTVIPKEGICAITSYVNPVRGGRNREAALAYMNQILSDSAMLALPKSLRYGPTTDVALGDIAGDILFKSPEHAKLKLVVDWKALMEQGPLIGERFSAVLRS
ncbi:putative spermidine/putrescine transport system substrate-binding protein [Bradyrhizobium sp. GM22.5]